jgi:hypothetical protein
MLWRRAILTQAPIVVKEKTMNNKFRLAGLALALAIVFLTPKVSHASCLCTLWNGFTTFDVYTPPTRMSKAQACANLYANQLAEAQSQALGYCNSLGQFGGTCSMTVNHFDPCFTEDDGNWYAGSKYVYQCMSCGIGG